MENIFENISNRGINFIKPDIEVEVGEIERVAQIFASNNSEEFVKQFHDLFETSELEDLSEEDWKNLENTDSFDIAESDWDAVAMHAAQGARDWEILRSKMESGIEIDAPIICRKDGTLHLVSGNTRLMVTRALGKTPKVVIVDMV